MRLAVSRYVVRMFLAEVKCVKLAIVVLEETISPTEEKSVGLQRADSSRSKRGFKWRRCDEKL